MALLGVVLAVLAAVVGTVWLFQRRLIYFPFEQEIPAVSSVLPGSEELVFTTRDVVRLAGWFVPAGAAEPLATVLVCNGNAGNRSYRAPLALALQRAGVSVLLFDYRGYGGNGGSPTEPGLYDDARAARDYLDTRGDVHPQRIVYYGESLGSAVALALAVERAPAALVLRSPFPSLVEIGRLHYPFLPVRLLLEDRYDALARIDRLQSPLLTIAGERDRIVPASMSRVLHDAAWVPKRFVLVPGADHNDLELLAGPRVIEEIVRVARGPPDRGGLRHP